MARCVELTCNVPGSLYVMLTMMTDQNHRGAGRGTALGRPSKATASDEPDHARGQRRSHQFVPSQRACRCVMVQPMVRNAQSNSPSPPGDQATLCAKRNLHIQRHRAHRHQPVCPRRLALRSGHGAGLCRQAEGHPGASLVCHCRGGFCVSGGVHPSPSLTFRAFPNKSTTPAT